MIRCDLASCADIDISPLRLGNKDVLAITVAQPHPHGMNLCYRPGDGQLSPHNNSAHAIRNTGSSPCTLQGQPVVAFVAGADNHQVGAATEHDPDPFPTITLSPGQTATALLKIEDAGNYDCNTPVSGLRVTPPGQTGSLVIAHDDVACTDTSFSTLGFDVLKSA
jgi:Protein of unknown function (DUF4232)